MLVHGIEASGTSAVFLTKVLRTLVGLSRGFFGKFSVEMFPITKLFRFGSLRKVTNK